MNNSTIPTLPIPVQTFPVTDDFTFETEKQQAADLADSLFEPYEREFTKRLSTVSEDIESHMLDFLDSIHRAANSKGRKRTVFVEDSLNDILACSPKKILAEFQKQSLIAGWAYVSVYNLAIDKLAELYPRCRAGIYASRLKYSDVLQISSEITETLHSCSTLLEDIQRRYEILESLQNNIQSDMETTEAEIILTAIRESFEDNARFAKSVRGNEGTIKKWEGYALQPITALGDIMTVPSLQIQGQIQRTRRIVVFIETAKMFEDGWTEWKIASNEIIVPNLKVMFKLKRDFFKNQILCLCDIATCNGYSLNGLPNLLKSIGPDCCSKISTSRPNRLKA